MIRQAIDRYRYRGTHRSEPAAQPPGRRPRPDVTDAKRSDFKLAA